MAPDTQKDRSARKKMVAQALKHGNPPVTNPRVLQAMESIPRHPFVPDPLRDQAYENRPLPIGQDQSTPAGLTSEILMNVRFVENRAEENY